MSWREEFLHLKERKPWNEVLIFLKKTIAENLDDVEVYVEAIYFLLDLLLYAKYKSDRESDEIADALKDLFDESYKRFSENAEYLFFVGYFIALAEWYFGQDNLELSNQMQKKALEIEPENILYKWADELSINRISANDLARKILSDSEKIRWLKSKGAAGEYMIAIIKSSSNSDIATQEVKSSV